jgi:hypothetical protein
MARTLALTLLLALVAAAPAGAADLEREGDKVTFEDRTGTREDLGVSAGGGNWQFAGAAGTATTFEESGGCVDGGSTASCPLTTLIEILLGAGDDKLRLAHPGDRTSTVAGGEGADTIDISQTFGATVGGGPGDDQIKGGAGPDVLRGEGGSDTIDARDGVRDEIDCGLDTDTAVVDSADAVSNCENVQLPDQDGFPRMTTPFGNRWRAGPSATKVLRLRITGAPAGSRVELVCSGKRKRCPFRTRQVAMRDGTATMAKLFKKPLKVGASLEVRLLNPDYVGKVIRYEMRRSRLPAPTALCMRPDATAPHSCT